MIGIECCTMKMLKNQVGFGSSTGMTKINLDANRQTKPIICSSTIETIVFVLFNNRREVECESISIEAFLEGSSYEIQHVVSSQSPGISIVGHPH